MASRPPEYTSFYAGGLLAAPTGSMQYLKIYWTKYRGLFLLSVTCVACEAACDLLQPRLMSRLIDDGAAVGDLDFVLRMGLVMLGVTGLGALFALSRNYTASLAS